MKPLERVSLILDAIKDVKARAKIAASDGNLYVYRALMGDLTALECTLVSETESLVDDINNKIAK